MDTVHLIGGEQVSNAGYAMQRAAKEMTEAASAIEWSLSNHRQWADDWLDRLQAIMSPEKNSAGEP